MITTQLLESMGACAPMLAKFRERFPDGVRPTLALAVQHAQDFDWDWAAEHLLSAEGWETYKAAIAPAKAAYEAARAAAWETYKAAIAPAQAAYKAARAPAFVTSYNRENP